MRFMRKAFTRAEVMGQTTSITSTTWTVPEGVTSISMVCIQASGAGTCQVSLPNASVPCRALNGFRIGDGGGDGGVGGTGSGASAFTCGGGGGAGGYSGSGGAGASAPAGTLSGAGTGGGGSGGGSRDSASGVGYGGGGTGLLGTGSNGTASTAEGVAGSGGANGSGQVGGNYGGGYGGLTGGGNGIQGGALAYKNNVSVTPGDIITITIGTATGSQGSVRIMYGGGRSYPSNAGNV